MSHAPVAPIMVVIEDFIGAGGAKAPIDRHLLREQIDKAVSAPIVREHSLIMTWGGSANWQRQYPKKVTPHGNSVKKRPPYNNTLKKVTPPPRLPLL